MKIASLSAIEILDSRGRPTLKVKCDLADGTTGSASVPSGASTGSAEALELRDRDPSRYDGMGCLKAEANVNGVLDDALRGQDIPNQATLDRFLNKLDGTKDKSGLGANALLGVSLAFARATASARGVELFELFAEMAGFRPAMPGLTVNLFSGGLHAGGQVGMQDVLLAKHSDITIRKSLEVITSVYRQASRLCSEKYGTRSLTADEGGLAPPFRSEEDMLHDAMDAIRAAEIEPTSGELYLAIDVASSHFYKDGRYHLGGAALTTSEMIDRLQQWSRLFPIISIEDGLAEDDWEGWVALHEVLGDQLAIMGDDLLCTNPARIEQAVATGAANALLLKLNQIGTVSEGLEALRKARDAGWTVVISARSGETEDDWLADLSVGWRADFIKVGSVTQSERLAKYNRLLEIEQLLQ